MINEVKYNLNVLADTRELLIKGLNKAKQATKDQDVETMIGLIEQARVTENEREREQKLEAVQKILSLPKFNSEAKLVRYINELGNATRTHNDTIKTLNEVVKRLETQTKETSTVGVADIQSQLDQLREFEKLGMIQILPDFYRENNLKKPIILNLEDQNEGK
jgi:hypothetical protein